MELRSADSADLESLREGGASNTGLAIKKRRRSVASGRADRTCVAPLPRSTSQGYALRLLLVTFITGILGLAVGITVASRLHSGEIELSHQDLRTFFSELKI